MLDGQEADSVLFQQLCGPDIIRLVFFFNRVNDFGIGMRLGGLGIVYGKDDGAPAGEIGGIDDIQRKRRDPAFFRRVSPDIRDFMPLGKVRIGAHG